MVIQHSIDIKTRGRDTTNITHEIAAFVTQSSISTGLCQLFLQHTSASLILCENADPDVRVDLEMFMSETVPDGHPNFLHTLEGPDDMAAHIRSIFTGNDLSIPISDGSLNLGTWQGIYLWEHRVQPHQRHLIITLLGE